MVCEHNFIAELVKTVLHAAGFPTATLLGTKSAAPDRELVVISTNSSRLWGMWLIWVQPTRWRHLCHVLLHLNSNIYCRIATLGSGSDFAPFVGGIGVTSVDLRYNFDESLNISSYPLYHSVYETSHLFETYIDPQFKVNLHCSGTLYMFLPFAAWILKKLSCVKKNFTVSSLACKSYVKTV